jgi:hypothetical protein
MIGQLTNPTALIAGVSLVWTMGTTAVTTAQKLTELDTRLDAIDHRLDKIADSLDNVAQHQIRQALEATGPNGKKSPKSGG